MICCGCTAQSRLTKNGLCRACANSRKQPTVSWRLRQKAALRWTTGENEVLLRRYNLTERQAVDRSMLALYQMGKLFERRVVYAHRLDNPYMQEHARKAVMAYIFAAQARPRKPGSGRKPARPERLAISARKVAA